MIVENMAQVINSFAPEKSLKYIVNPEYSNRQLPKRNGHKCTRSRCEC